MAKDIMEYLDLCSDSVKKNVVVVDKSETLTPYMLHMSSEKTPKYVPRIGHRQGNTEDRTLPRITVSTCLTGCFLGYATALSDFLDQSTLSGKNEIKDWKGGFYIHKLPFEKAFKPNSKLVYDQIATDEHWLVAYSEDTRVYPSEMIGKIVFDSVKLTPTKPGEYDVTFSLFIEVRDVFYFDPVTPLEPGFYSVTMVNNRNSTYRKTMATVNPITKDMFKERKAAVANNLSVNNSAIYKAW